MMNKNPLGAFGVKQFLRDYWQKKPLVLRGIAPGLAGALGRADLMDIACREDAESRLVIGSGRRWQVRHGPFRRRDFAKLPSRNWTLLVNGIDNLVPAARALQLDFGFIPFARQDDVMVSYAAPGGGVGPHFDSYDVFLLQGAGTRRWRISKQQDLSLIEGAPLKILNRFRADEDMMMDSGDMLYLPPDHAHHGTAIGECLTWSVGMRAPRQNELVSQFLDYLQDHLTADAVYRDPRLERQKHRAEIAPRMQNAVRGMIDAIRWRNADVDRCLGELLSEPRQNVVFATRQRSSESAFSRSLFERGVRLDLKSRMLFDRRLFFINGEAFNPAAGDKRALQQLADDRVLPAGTRLTGATVSLLCRWYRAGYVELGAAAATLPAQKKRAHH